MTRSGCCAAAAAAMAANGYGVSVPFGFGSLQLCVPLSVCRRQPVSPMMTIRVGFAFGSGSVWPATTALVVPDGSGYSHELTGNSAGLPGPPPAAPPMRAAALIPGAVFTVRAGMLVVAAARRFICTGVPPLIVMVGHGFAPAPVGTYAVNARAMATLPVRPLIPLGPVSSTHADST